MTTIYLNTKTREGVETLDQFTQGEDAPSKYSEFKKYVREMAYSYYVSGQNVYLSIRSTKKWRER